jgi:large subunit ribosomal protein L9
MKILLCRDVDRLGWLGDVVEVSTGYARNYLLPQRLAVAATPNNIKTLGQAKVRAAAERQQARQQLEALSAAVDGAEVVIAAKANEQGHLFGSVSSLQIAENLRMQGFAVPDDAVDEPVHIKQIGTYPVVLRLGADVTAQVKVVVVAEGGLDSEAGSGS